MQRKRFISDFTAGLTVSFAAISLGAAFGVMSGRGAFAGMIGAAVIPIITSLFGGTRLQASGPTAPMTAVSALTVAFAYDQFPEKALAEQFITFIFILNAILLTIVGILKLGKLISFVPNVVILGFMNGIAVLIWKDQIVKVFALAGNQVMMGGVVMNVLLALLTFGLIYTIAWGVKRLKFSPILRSLSSGVLWSIILMTTLAVATELMVQKTDLGNTVGSFGEFTAMLVNYFPGGEIIQWTYFKMALPFVLQLTLLAYLDSLLTALVIDRMTKEKSNLNKELIAQGFANGASGFFQGIPGAQATIRSVLLIKEGAQTRLAGVLIGVFALLSILVFNEYLSLVPAAVFVGVLLKAGLDVFDKDFLRYYFNCRWHTLSARNIQLLFILYTTVVTVVVDLNIAVLTGTVLFYLAKYFWKIKDVEGDFEEVSDHVLPEPTLVPGNEVKSTIEVKSLTTEEINMNLYKALLDGNKEWVRERLEQDATYFDRLSKGQSPQFLWIGCSDSRVPANEITRTRPGDIFVHRNIANMVVHSDMNLLSVLDYAVNILKVKHVIVCGHYGCGGVKAAMDNTQYGLVDNWLRFIKDVYRTHHQELDSIKSEEQRFDRFVELNVIEQVFDLTKTTIIQNAWRERNEPKVHGWVYSLKTGLIKDLHVSFDSSAKLPPIYRVDGVSKAPRIEPVEKENQSV